jgi:hypothetical protein
MSAEEVNEEELKKASDQWKEKIAVLQKMAEAAEGGQKREIAQLLEQLKQQQVIIDRHLKTAGEQEESVGGEGAADLDRLFDDIDATYRKALAYFP